ncbi:hypothetical protein PR001_g32879, partial [Phytophthora rubi]
MDNYVAMRHLHAYLPYVELEIKSWPIARIIKWGKGAEGTEPPDASAPGGGYQTPKAPRSMRCTRVLTTPPVPPRRRTNRGKQTTAVAVFVANT